MPAAFHERVRAGFLAVARAEPERCLLIDASRAADDVASAVRALVARRFDLDLTQSG
jgi:dTMP kinase